MSSYLCTETDIPNGMFVAGKKYPVIEVGYHGLTVTLADERGVLRTIGTKTRRFIVANENKFPYGPGAPSRYARFEPTE